MVSPIIWAGGLAGSVLVHAALFGLWTIVYQPDPVVPQETPETSLDVQTQRMERTAAAERSPESPKADAIAPKPATAMTASPRLTAATAIAAPPGPAVTGADPRPVQLEAQTPPAPSGNADPSPVRLDAQPPAGTQARPVAADTQRLVTSAAPIEPANEARIFRSPVAALKIAPEQAAAVRAPGTDVIAAAASGNRIAPEPPRARVAPLLPENAAQVTATLAFSGGDTQIDPVSLAAFQSFMRPNDAARHSDALRDGIGQLLAGVPCARLQVLFDPDTTTLRVQGHVPEAGLRGPVLAALRAEMGADIAVSDSMMILPRPQCGALTGIADVGLPQSTDQITNPRLIGADTQARVLEFVRDDRLFFDLTAPDYDAYVYVDYFDAAGNVLHLMPNDQVSKRLFAAETSFRVGARSDDDEGLQIFIGPPYGQEIAVAFAASEPLYEGVRPIIEPAAPYLDWLRDRVRESRARDPGFKGEWVYFLISTADR